MYVQIEKLKTKAKAQSLLKILLRNSKNGR